MAMAKMTYSEQLKHPNWQRRRLEMLDAADFECDECGNKESMLHVHHRHYIKGRMAWEYSDEELSVLCEGCHKDTHKYEGYLKEMATELQYQFLPAFVAGYLEDGPEAFGVRATLKKKEPIYYAIGNIARVAEFAIEGPDDCAAIMRLIYEYRKAKRK
jgi:hypothetical protein